MDQDQESGIDLSDLYHHKLLKPVRKSVDTTRAKLRHRISDPFVNIDKPPLDNSLESRVKWGLANAAVPAGGEILIRKLLKQKTSPASLGITAATGFASGFFTPDIYNYLHEAKKKRVSEKKLIKFHETIKGLSTSNPKDIKRKMDYIQSQSQKLKMTPERKARLIHNSVTYKPMEKTAIWSTLIKPAIGLGRIGFNIAATGLKAIGTGLKLTPKDANIGRKAFGLGTKLTAIGGTMYGGSKVYEHYNTGSGPTYTTALRNNILGGRVNSDELSTGDLTAIKDLGMR